MISSWPVAGEVAHFINDKQRTNLYRMIEDGKAFPQRALSGYVSIGAGVKNQNTNPRFPDALSINGACRSIASEIDLVEVSVVA